MKTPIPMTKSDLIRAQYLLVETQALVARMNFIVEAARRENVLGGWTSDHQAEMYQTQRAYAVAKAELNRLLEPRFEAGTFSAAPEANDPSVPQHNWSSPDALLASAKALLDLDADGALVPHGIGGHARNVIEGFLALVETEKPAPAEPYRLLETSEIVQEGDQFRVPLTDDWHPVTATGFAVGFGERSYRRPITGGAGLHESATVSQEPASVTTGGLQP